MANKTLKKQVIEQLTSKIRSQYEQGGLQLNTDTKTIKNYNLLCQTLDKIRKTNFKNASVSTNQLMKLFTVSEQVAEESFKLDFLDLCFWYAYEMSCESYLETQPIENQVIPQIFFRNKLYQPLETKSQQPLETENEALKADLAQKIGELKDLKQQNVDLNLDLNQQKISLEQHLKQNNLLNVDLNQQKIDLDQCLKQNKVLNGSLNLREADLNQKEVQVELLTNQKQSFFHKVLCLGAIALLSSGAYAWHWHELRYEQLIWLNGYNLNAADEAVYLKAKLPFITDSTSAFRKNVRTWVQLLLQGYQKLDNLPKTAPNPNLIHYADLSKSLQTAYKINNDLYYTNIATWRDPNRDSISPINTLLDSVNTLFRDYVNDLMRQNTLWLHNKKTDEFFFESFFEVSPSERYKPIFMFTVFKSDASSFNQSQEIMVRYPPYDTTNTDAAGKTYHLQTRPWWRDANDNNRTNAFCWREMIEGQLVTMGLSRAYSSIRLDNRMQQRAFWVEIPVRKPNKFFLCIDWMLKID
jgi:hypothetical protein